MSQPHSKKHIAAVISLFVVFLFIFLILTARFYSYLHQTKNISIPLSQSASTSKVWQILFNYNTQTQKLALTSVTVKKGIATSSPSHTSQYQLLALNKTKQVLFQTDIHIAEQILYNVYYPLGSTRSGELFQQPQELTTLISIPYLPDAETIVIQKNGATILEFTPPKQISLNFIAQAYAATCNMLHIIFISDGYADLNKFHADVAKVQNTFVSKEPYASNSNIFDFQTVDNPTSNNLGCIAGGSLNINCLSSGPSLQKITNVVFCKLPNLPQDATYTKIVVLVDGTPFRVGPGYILGVANTLGGQFGVFQNRLFLETTASMEVLGHDVGELYDRYLYPANSAYGTMGKIIQPPFASNCSVKPNGEAFWKNAGIVKAYSGCTSQYMYAPAPLDCGNGGSSTTLMSAAQCGGQNFDPVEQYYIKTNILPRYQCAATPTATTAVPQPTATSLPHTSTFLQTPTATPTPQKQNSSSTFYNCIPDPNCKSGSGALQVCALKCTAK